MSSNRDGNYWQRLAQGRVNRRRVLSGGATVLTGGIALGLVGCGSSNNNSGAKNAATQAATQGAASATKAATAAATASSVATAAGTAKPAGSPAAGGSPAAAAAGAAPTLTPAGNFKTGGTIQGFITGTAALDPVANTTYRSSWFAGFHYGRLFRLAAANDPQVTLNRTPVPDHVLGYEITPDGLTYTMKLRQGLNFTAPLNRPFTSADVKASWDYFTTSPKNTNKDVYAPIVDSLTTPDANTIVWKLKAPYSPFLNKLASPQYMWMLSQEAATGKIDPEQVISGTGPWIFVSNNATAITWKKNPDYFLKGLPYADGAVLNVIPDSSTLEAQFQAGKIDHLYAGSPPTADADALKKAVPKAMTYEYAPNGMAFLFFSTPNDPASPFKDPRARLAASMAVDRQGLIDSIYAGKGVFSNIVNAGLGKWYLDPNGKDIGDNGKYFKHDIQTAKQLLQASGTANTDLKFFYPNNAYGDVFNATCDAVRGMLADVGFKVQTVTVDYLKDWINNGQGYYQNGLPPNSIGLGLMTPFTDPDDFLTGILTKDGNRNPEKIDDPTLTPLILQQRSEADETKRQKIVWDVQAKQAGLMYYAPLIYTKYINFTQPWVQNYNNVDDYDLGTEQWAYMSVNNK